MYSNERLSTFMLWHISLASLLGKGRKPLRNCRGDAARTEDWVTSEEAAFGSEEDASTFAWIAELVSCTDVRKLCYAHLCLQRRNGELGLSL